MKARDLIGRKIVKVNQSFWREANSGPCWTIDSLVLDNGSIVVFHVIEGESAYGVEVSVLKREKKV